MAESEQYWTMTLLSTKNNGGNPAFTKHLDHEGFKSHRQRAEQMYGPPKEEGPCLTWAFEQTLLTIEGPSEGKPPIPLNVTTTTIRSIH